MRPYYLFVLFIILPFFSKASAYWMEINGSGKVGEAVTIQLIYGNIDESGIRHRQTGKELTLAGEFQFSLVEPSGKRTPLKMQLKADCWEATFNPQTKGTYAILGLNNSHPVVDRSKTGGENILPIDYLCSRYVAGMESAIQQPLAKLDIIVTKSEKGVLLRVFKDQQKIKQGTKLRVFNPDNWEKELVVDADGTASFFPKLPGMYVIRVDDVEEKAGIYKELAYKSIRSRCNYCLFVE